MRMQDEKQRKNVGNGDGSPSTTKRDFAICLVTFLFPVFLLLHLKGRKNDRRERVHPEYET